ncbi:MAG: hypothetical protein IPL36_10970 [Nigerium sp.]|nr:hypothetical protein [Nigerium sp.]
MLHYELPTSKDLLHLGTPRVDALSIYVATEPTPAGRDHAFTSAKSAVDEAIRALRAAGRSHADQEALREQWELIAAADELWGNLASSLVVFIAPGFADEYVLPNAFEAHTHFGERFDLGPLVRAVTTPQRAYALTLSSSGWNLWEATESSRASEFPLVGDHAEDAADATNRMSIRGRKLLRRLGGDEGQKVLLDRYAQVVAGAVRDELARVDPAGDVPLFVFANEPLASMVVAHGLPGEVVGVRGAADELRPDQIDEAIRERIGEITTRALSRAADKIGNGFADGLVGTDVAQVARAAAVGAVGTLYYDLTADVRGVLDSHTGAIRFDPEGEDLLAAIALLVLANGGEVHAVRPGEIEAGIWNGRLLAGLRRPLI